MILSLPPLLLLGLAEPTANLVEIKRSYQKHAMLYYPNAVLVMELAAKERDEASKDFA